MIAEPTWLSQGGGDDAGSDDGRRTDWAIDPPVAGAGEDPIERLYVDHQRQRRACDLLERVADGEVDEDGVRGLIDFLERDVAAHVAEEENALFPLLRAHCLEEDDIDSLLTRLSGEHADADAATRAVVADLRSASPEGGVADDARTRLRDYAEDLRRHLAIENAALLPLARVRLDARALGSWTALAGNRRPE
jgi:hemerythrin-like domain-containing protein